MASGLHVYERSFLPYEIAEALVPRNCDAAEGRDVLVAIAGLAVSQVMTPEWHKDLRPIGAASADAQGGSNGQT
jgi:hypothetical protein